ncbi:MAG: malectin [Lentisphaeria bacterium]|nr:malectin [Lentisphaeria bacterium]
MKRKGTAHLWMVPVLVLAGCVALPMAREEAVWRINCGGPALTDAGGTAWIADGAAAADAAPSVTGGQAIERPASLEIAATETPELYRTERYGAMTYTFPVPDGVYAVRLHFAETYEGITAVGQRVFTVNVNGLPALVDFDILQQAGAFAKPFARTVDGVVATGGSLRVEFVPKTQNPAVNAIEILRD